jgi:RsiW-degrading membrane proteinase PrsW (M82 family)
MTHYAPISYAILIASVIPLVFLYLIKWLNFFETHRARLILLALAWGALSVELSYLVDHPLRLTLGAYFVATRSAPIVEEIFKSLILLYLVRRADTTFFVDGAVYGFAAGIGFAIAENMLFLSRMDIDTGIVLSTTRAFMSSVQHGSTTAIVGMALGGFPLGRVNHPLLRWVVGLAMAIAIHMAYNNTAFHHFVFGHTGIIVLATIAFCSLTVVAAAILWGLRLERRSLRKSLGMKAGATKGEAMLVQRIEDLDDILAPIEEKFGEVKREQVANALLLSAQLAMKQDQIRKTRDDELRVEIAAQITELKRELKQARSDVGIYIMSHVRSIVGKTTWSLWARLSKTLEKLGPAKVNVWQALAGKLPVAGPASEALHHRVQAALNARAQAGALAIEAEEE